MVEENSPGRTAEEVARDVQTTLNSLIECPPNIQDAIATALREYAKAEVAKVKADSEIIAKAHNDIVRNWDEEIAEVRSKALTEAAGVCFGQYEWHMKHERYCCAKTAKQCRSGILALQSSPDKGVGV